MPGVRWRILWCHSRSGCLLPVRFGTHDGHHGRFQRPACLPQYARSLRSTCSLRRYHSVYSGTHTVAGSSAKEKTVKLPDGDQSHSRTERFGRPKVLFQPGFIYEETSEILLSSSAGRLPHCGRRTLSATAVLFPCGSSCHSSLSWCPLPCNRGSPGGLKTSTGEQSARCTKCDIRFTVGTS